MNKNNEIIKTKALKCFNKWHHALAAREVAKKIWGDLKVAESFLYLYSRFGTPTYDTNDEYKISYEYNFKYKGLCFSLCGTTPDFVYLDCYMPNKYFLLQRVRYRKDVRELFDRAVKDSILVYPWASNDDLMPSLTKHQYPWLAITMTRWQGNSHFYRISFRVTKPSTVSYITGLQDISCM